MSSRINIFSKAEIGLELQKAYISKGLNAIYYPRETINDNDPQQYCIFIVDYETLNDKVTLQKYLEFAEHSYKSLFIFNYANNKSCYEKLLEWQKEISEKSIFVSGTIYIGDIIDNGDFIDLGMGLVDPIHTATVFFPVSLKWLLDEILKLTFSMKAYGQKTALIGLKIFNINNKEFIQSSYNFYPEFTQVEICPERITINFVKYSGETKYSGLNNISNENVLNSEEKISPDKEKITGFNKFVDDGDRTLPSQVSIKNKAEKVITTDLFSSQIDKNKKPTAISKLKKYLKLFAVAIFGSVAIYAVLPFVLYYSAILILKVSFHKIINDRPLIGSNLLLITDFLSDSSFNLSQKNRNTFLLGKVYQYQSDRSKELNTVSNIYKNFISVDIETLDIFKKFVNGEFSDKFSEFRELSTNLNYLQTNIGFIQADQDRNTPLTKFPFLRGKDIENLRQDIIHYKNLCDRLEVVLGKDGLKKYALVLQNSDIQKPSGGQITAVGIIEVTGGKIINFTFYDAKSIGTKLAGEVDVPGDFNRFFKGENWNLGSANWFSDFALSGEKISWFVDKELDVKLDGVFAIDSDVLEKLSEDLKSTDSENKTTSKNIHSQIKIVGEDNDQINKFIEIYNALMIPQNFNDNKITKNINTLLQNKHILLYFNSDQLEQILADLSWNGSVKQKDCDGNCFFDIAGIYEIAKTSGSRNIDKEVTLDISLEEGIIKKRLTVFAKNRNEFDYDAIFRILASAQSGFSDINLILGDSKKTVEGSIFTYNGIKEDNVLLSIKKGETAVVSYYWEEPYHENQAVRYFYKLNFIKEPGEREYNFTINLNLPAKAKLIDKGGYSLTDGGKLVYNTRLSADLITEISWQR
jgi:hypothetical protein